MPPGVTTSTPAAVGNGNSFMAATPHLSVIHDGSFISGNNTHDGTFSESTGTVSSSLVPLHTDVDLVQASTVTAKVQCLFVGWSCTVMMMLAQPCKPQSVSDWEVELWMARLLHATYADVMVSCSELLVSN